MGIGTEEEFDLHMSIIIQQHPEVELLVITGCGCCVQSIVWKPSSPIMILFVLKMTSTKTS